MKLKIMDEGSPNRVIYHYAEQLGWAEDLLVEILLEFIEVQGVGMQDRFAKFVTEKAVNDAEESGDFDEEEEEE